MDQRCSENPQDRIGDPEGACDSELDHYQKLVVSNLNKDSGVDDVSRSPAYEAIKSLKITEYQVGRAEIALM